MCVRVSSGSEGVLLFCELRKTNFFPYDFNVIGLAGP